MINKVEKLDLPRYLLGPGDELLIKIYKFEDFNSNVKILPDGTVNLPRINSLYLNNLSIDEANKVITKSYKQILKNPIIYINLIRSRPIKININGEVQRPGIYSLETNQTNQISNTDGGEALLNNNKGWPTIVDAIQQAGGLTVNADLRKIRLKRFNKDKNNYEEIIINFWHTISQGGFTKNYEIFDGDIISVMNSEIATQEEKSFISSTNLSPQQLQ